MNSTEYPALERMLREGYGLAVVKNKELNIPRIYLGQYLDKQHFNAFFGANVDTLYSGFKFLDCFFSERMFNIHKEMPDISPEEDLVDRFIKNEGTLSIINVNFNRQDYFVMNAAESASSLTITTSAPTLRELFASLDTDNKLKSFLEKYSSQE